MAIQTIMTGVESHPEIALEKVDLAAGTVEYRFVGAEDTGVNRLAIEIELPEEITAAIAEAATAEVTPDES